MREMLRGWWRTRTAREQALIVAMLAIAALVLAWLLVVRPLGDALSAARERHGAAVVTLAEARAQASTIGALERAPRPSGAAPVEETIAGSAAEAGFAVTRIEREGDKQATLAMDSARPEAFFGWVQRMESGGLIVERLRATSNSDRTLAVQVTFRARSR